MLNEGTTIIVTSPHGFFGGVGAHIFLPTTEDSCSVWSASNQVEWATTEPVDGMGDDLLLYRGNGEVWLIEKGIGCLSLGLGARDVLVHSPGLFLGVSSRLIVPRRSQDCSIWDAERLR